MSGLAAVGTPSSSGSGTAYAVYGAVEAWFRAVNGVLQFAPSVLCRLEPNTGAFSGSKTLTAVGTTTPWTSYDLVPANSGTPPQFVTLAGPGQIQYFPFCPAYYLPVGNPDSASDLIVTLPKPPAEGDYMVMPPHTARHRPPSRGILGWLKG